MATFCLLRAKPLLLLSLLLSTSQLVLSKVHLHKWDISYQFKSPDSLKKLAISINGDTPGPAIYAQQGDTIVVQVNNSLITDNTAIHWHGIRQIGTPWFDGTEGVTQCPILPGDTFVYRFTVDRHLHGHDFWVLAFGMGKFVPGRDEKEFNLVDPIMKNTVAVHPYRWTAIRFLADNPGAWPFHCNIESHFFMGMGVVFAEGVDNVGRLPRSIMGCDDP